MKPEQIQAGCSYLLQGTFGPISVVRRVEEIRGSMVVVEVNGDPKEFDLKMFARLAREEVSA